MTPELAFTDDEVASLLAAWGARVPAGAAEDLRRATAGWPAAVALWAPRIAAAPDPAAEIRVTSDSPSLLGALLGRVLDALDATDRAALTQLAHLGLLSDEVAMATGAPPALLDRAVAAGLPMQDGRPGWRYLPDPVAEHLASAAPLDGRVASAAARIYAINGETMPALLTLLAGGRPAEAGALVAGLSPAVAERLDPAEIRAVVHALPEPTRLAHPRALLQLARALERTYESTERTAALREAERNAAAGGDLPALREVRAEIALDLVRDGDLDQARSMASEVLRAAGDDEMVARARALDCLGRLESLWGVGEVSARRGESLLREAAMLAIRAGHSSWAAGSLYRLTEDVLQAWCRFDEAIEIVDQALGLLPGRGRARALLLQLKADVLVDAGRIEQAAVITEEARTLGRTLGDARLLAYAGWSELAMAVCRDDPALARSAIQEVERHRGDWFEGFGGLSFLSFAADVLDRLRDSEGAAAYLARARAREHQDAREFRWTEAMITARSGDPAEGRRLVECELRTAAAKPNLEWRLRMLRAFAAARNGDIDAGRLAADAFERCGALGVAPLASLTERAAVSRLLPLAAEAGSPVAEELTGAGGRTAIRALGTFQVLRGGRTLELPPGRPELAVKALVAAGGRMHAEELIEALWPDVEPATGRARLRNLLNRVRAAAPDLVVREGESIALAGDVDVDVFRFEDEARRALAAASQRRTGEAATLAMSAVGRYRGSLLPEDPYEPWTAAARERLRGRQLRLLDLLASHAERHDEVDEAARVLDQAILEEPYDDFGSSARPGCWHHRVASAPRERSWIARDGRWRTSTWSRRSTRRGCSKHPALRLRPADRRIRAVSPRPLDVRWTVPPYRARRDPVVRPSSGRRRARGRPDRRAHRGRRERAGGGDRRRRPAPGVPPVVPSRGSGGRRRGGKRRTGKPGRRAHPGWAAGRPRKEPRMKDRTRWLVPAIGVVAVAGAFVVLSALAASAGTASARGARATCDVTLTTGAVYGSGLETAGDVCVAPGGPGAAVMEWGNYTWQSVTIEDGASLVVTLQHSCGPGMGPSSLTLTNGGTIEHGGTLGLSDPINCFGGGESDLYVTGGTLVNHGTISADACDDSSGCLYGSNGSTGARGLSGSIANDGTIRSDTKIPILYYGGTLANQGAIDLGASDPNIVGHGLYVEPGAGAVLVNGNGGSIDATNGDVYMDGGNTYVQGAGTSTGTIALVNDALKYTGTGSSQINVEGSTTVAGNLAYGQSLRLATIGCGGPGTATATFTTDSTTAGTIDTSSAGCLGPGGVALAVAPGKTFTNTGTILFGGNFTGSSTVQGRVANQGSFTVDLGQWDGGNQSLQDLGGSFTNSGTFTVAGTSTFEVSGTGVMFANSTGGSVADEGIFQMDAGNTYVQGSGSVTGNMPLLVSDTLDLTGAGAGSFDLEGTTTVNGNVAAGQLLNVHSTGCGGPGDATATFPNNTTNAGTITSQWGGCFGGPGNATVVMGAGTTLTNTGMITSGNAANLMIHGTVTNRGTIQATYHESVTMDALRNYSSASNTLTGGTYIVTDGGYGIVVPGMDIHTNAASITLYSGSLSDGANNALRDLSANQGKLSLLYARNGGVASA